MTLLHNPLTEWFMSFLHFLWIVFLLVAVYGGLAAIQSLLKFLNRRYPYR